MFEIFNSTFKIINEMFSYPFMQRALIVGVLISLCAAVLGVSLVLKRYSMIGYGLSNVGFAALSIAMALNLSPLTLSMPIVIIAAFLLLRLNDSSKIKGDSAIAFIAIAATAAGVMVISISTGLNADVCNYLFGSILGMTTADVRLSIMVSVVCMLMFIIFYNRIFAVTFDETFAQATGTRSGIYNTVIAILTALIVVVGMRMMGSLLISSLIVFPALSSMRIFKRFKSVVIS